MVKHYEQERIIWSIPAAGVGIFIKSKRFPLRIRVFEHDHCCSYTKINTQRPNREVHDLDRKVDLKFTNGCPIHLLYRCDKSESLQVRSYMSPQQQHGYSKRREAQIVQIKCGGDLHKKGSHVIHPRDRDSN